MKPARLVVLVVAVCAAGVAALIMMNSGPSTPVVIERKTPSASIEVLIAAADLSVGQKLKPTDIKWQPWPVDLVPAGTLTKSSAPEALEETTGSIVRTAILAGEPVRREKLVKADGSGFMSAILPSGMRAIAISIDTRGATTAGGFILPNDRVDVLRVYRDEEISKQNGQDAQVSETILQNVRVLAIGSNVQDKNGEKVVTGETATLEVTPAQAEQLALAQRTGTLALALRSLADASQPNVRREDKQDDVTVVRFGVGRTAKR